MFDNTSRSGKPGFLRSRYLAAAFAIAYVCATAVYADAANMINAVTAESSGSNHSVRIHGSEDPAYTAYELFDPARIVLDVADASIADLQGTTLPAGLPFGMATSTVSGSDPALTRFEFTFDREQSYTGYTVQAANNSIILAVTMGDAAGGKDSLASQLPQVDFSAPPTVKGTENTAASEQSKQEFGFSGYNNQRISVDFYKIDLHNVFRLIREVSKMNIVVDEAVNGSLTLALNDVPWDFALDIILNLKDLQKEERYNTIVILPRAKDFVWPERAASNISFVPDEGIESEQAIVIQQQMSVSPEIAEAKKLVQQGRDNEKSGHYGKAIKAYSEALAKWPDNDRLANKIASIYLVYLRQNAKAVYFAKQALQINDQNSAAALNAAIALANMQEFANAQQYFAQSVSTDKPSQEALLSYAVFSEQQEEYDSAIKLLEKFEDMYGPTLDSMVSQARILDKQGKVEAATEKYKSILLSGYQIPPDLKKYVKSRIALNQSM